MQECKSSHCRNTPPLGREYCGKCAAALEAASDLEDIEHGLDVAISAVTDPETRNALELFLQYVQARTK